MMLRIWIAVLIAWIACPRIATAASAPVQMLVIGDSVAFGQGASDPRKSFAFTAYRDLAARRPGSTIDNHAIGGARIRDVTRLQLSSATPQRADVVVVEAGANDVVHGASSTSVASDMRALLHAVRKRYPRALLIVCGVPDISISPIFHGAEHDRMAVLSARADKAIFQVAKAEHARFVDVYRMSRAIHGKLRQFLGSDSFHPSDQGHAAIAALIIPELRRAFP